jgi:hypothetical protein
MSQRFRCPQGHRWQVSADGCDVLPGDWIVCPLCGARPEAPSVPLGDGLTPAQRLARAADPDAHTRRPWSRLAGLWPVLLGGFVLLVVLPALVWVTLLHYQQRAVELQHLREVEAELQEHRDAAQRNLEAARLALDKLEAQSRELLRQVDSQRAPALSPEEQAALEELARGRPGPKDGK